MRTKRQVDALHEEMTERNIWVIEVPDPDAALEWAGKAAAACERPIEVRPLQG